MDSISNLSIDYFIDKESAKEFECPICFCIMEKICEFDKCGHLLCEKCIIQIKECPLCTDKEIAYHLSKYLERKLMNLKIKCSIENCNKIISLNDLVVHSKSHLLLNIESKTLPNYKNIEHEEHDKNNIFFTIKDNIKSFTKIFSWLSSYFEEVTLRFSKTGIKIININNNNDKAIHIEFNIDKFDKYYSSNDYNITIKTRALKIIDDCFKSDELKFLYDDINNPNKISIIEKDNIGYVYSKNTINIDHEVPRHFRSSFEINYRARIHITYIEYFFGIGSVKISFDKQGITFQHGTNKIIRIRKQSLMPFFVNIDAKESNSYYELDSIIKFAKMNGCNYVELCLSDDNVLIAKYNLYYATVMILVSKTNLIQVNINDLTI